MKTFVFLFLYGLYFIIGHYVLESFKKRDESFCDFSKSILTLTWWPIISVIFMIENRKKKQQ